MSTKEEFEVFRVATFTLSDTRTPSDDVGGRVLVDRLRAAGFSITSHVILREEPDELRASITHVCDADLADAIVLTGGTGIAPRDRTIEVVEGMLDKTIDGFGEAFRRLSWEQIGPRAILSRAIAGVVRGKVIAALPGSPSAVELAVDALLAPTLSHAIALASGRGGKHAAHGHHGKHGRKH
ncbi:MogA/MoaB family molybdenum cofactor biosynthesis protein [Polyangium spumosum]|uniref:Molybdenum cofactor biosynthesis protein B n=1 Tax=Polyangium spumosum TaxID=889282 RepID=A0A6N7PGC2_9BACT|nr:molybdenum cofactor biosynthesis protein B [Polyangium spumosum]MRG91049.1 molybdenum cofactor biosynthesis protein MoaB [Polyangium spumosum]